MNKTNFNRSLEKGFPTEGPIEEKSSINLVEFVCFSHAENRIRLENVVQYCGRKSYIRMCVCVALEPEIANCFFSPLLRKVSRGESNFLLSSRVNVDTFPPRFRSDKCLHRSPKWEKKLVQILRMERRSRRNKPSFLFLPLVT